MEDRFEAERRRLHQEMEAEIEKVRAAYRRRLDAVDRAEELMDFAASGDGEAPVEGGPPPSIPATGSLREDLARWVAGRSEPFNLDDAEARFPGTSRDALRTHLAQMAKAGTVKIVEAGDGGQPTRYETPEPDYAAVPPRSS